MSGPTASYDFRSGTPEEARLFLRSAWWRLRQLRKVRVWKDKLQVIDVNKDYFEVSGVGYEDPEVVPLLRVLNTAFDPATIHEPTRDEYKELSTGRRHPWAEDRVM